MTQEEKDLLIKYLCAALPYGVLVNYKIKYDNVERATILNGNHVRDIMDGISSWIEFKPYLRPMSSMTEEEDVFYNTVYTTLKFYDKVDWLNSCHFDYRGLIEKGLAIKVDENNNPYKD